MSQCWSEGELRAYLDGELPVRDIERAASHLKECPACGRVYAEVAERATSVEALLELLPEPLAPSKAPAIPKRAARGRRWIAAAGLAAALAVALVMAPWRSRPESGPVPPPPPTAAKITPAPAPPVAPPQPLKVKPAIVRRKAPAMPKPRVEDYVALDDEPIETGVVVRVGLSGGQVPADVIFGPDGRARAIRLVSDISGAK